MDNNSIKSYVYLLNIMLKVKEIVKSHYLMLFFKSIFNIFQIFYIMNRLGSII
jgi:hypothetical protein